MKLSKANQSRIRTVIIPELTRHYSQSREPVALNDLPSWKGLKKSDKIKLGRGFKGMVAAGEIDGIKFVGKRADNHSTYRPTGNGGASLGFLRKLFG